MTPESSIRWLPISGWAVAAMGQATLRQFLPVQLLYAGVMALCTALAVWQAWFPAMEQACSRLPDQILLSHGRLSWAQGDRAILAENPWLAIELDRNGGAVGRLAADLQITLRPDSFRVTGLLGSVTLVYPEFLRLAGGRVHAVAWWGAWNWVMGLAVIVGALLWVLLWWWLLASLYTPAILALGELIGRSATPGVAWRLASAALLSGGLLMTPVVLLYGLHVLPVYGLVAGTVLHVLVGWWACLWGTVRLPVGPSRTSTSPFIVPPPAALTKKEKPRNPFQGS